MSSKWLLERLRRGHFNNVRFAEMVALIESFGFRETRRRGSHRIYARPDVRELLNLQEVGGQVKPYQIRQFLTLVRRYNLKPEARE